MVNRSCGHDHKTYRDGGLLSTQKSLSESEDPHSRPQLDLFEAVYIPASPGRSYLAELADGKKFGSSDLRIRIAHRRGFKVQLKPHDLYTIYGRNMVVQL